MVRAQKRGMGKMREWTARTKDKNTDRHASRYSEACLGGGSRPSGHAPVLTSAGAEQPPQSPVNQRVGERKKRREGHGGEKMEGEGMRIGVQHL